MPRAKKNPITEMPVLEMGSVMGEPEKYQTEPEKERPQSNVVPISNGLESIQSERDWNDVDRVLSDVVSFV